MNIINDDILVWEDFTKQKVVSFNDYLKLHQKYHKTIEALKKIEGGPGVDGSLEAFCVLKELGIYE